MNKKIKIICILLIFVSSCSDKNNLYDTKNITLNNLPAFEKINDKNIYIIRYSNVIVKFKGKIIKIPIYGGIYGDIELDKLKINYKEKDGYILENIKIPVKNGHYTETFRDILKFYKKNLLKNVDINNPAYFFSENNVKYTIVYLFENEGIPSGLYIDADMENVNTNVENFKLKEIDGFIWLTFTIIGKNP